MPSMRARGRTSGENMAVPAEASPKGKMAHAPTIMPRETEAPPPAFPARFPKKMYMAQQKPAPSAKATPTGSRLPENSCRGKSR